MKKQGITEENGIITDSQKDKEKTMEDGIVNEEGIITEDI